MYRLVFHEALCLAFAVDKFTEHQLPQPGTPFLPSPIHADGQPQPVADIATNCCLGPFVGEIWWLAWVLKDLWGKEVGHITRGSSRTSCNIRRVPK
jgi:hypothetical protein